MKQKLKQIISPMVIAATLLLLPIVPTGCTTTSTTAYKVTTGTYYTVDAALTAWGDYVRIYRPPVAQEAKVASAYKAWQTASVAVVDTAKAAKAGDSSTQAKVNAAVAASATALNGLIAVLAQFGINLVPQ